MERSDQELIKGYLAGSDHDFGILFERYKNQLYGYLMKMIPESKTDVDDVFQKTWIKVMLKLPFYNTSSGHFQAWLFRIGHNLSIDFFRSSCLVFKQNFCPAIRCNLLCRNPAQKDFHFKRSSLNSN